MTWVAWVLWESSISGESVFFHGSGNVIREDGCIEQYPQTFLINLILTKVSISQTPITTLSTTRRLTLPAQPHQLEVQNMSPFRILITNSTLLAVLAVCSSTTAQTNSSAIPSPAYKNHWEQRVLGRTSQSPVASRPGQGWVRQASSQVPIEDGAGTFQSVPDSVDLGAVYQGDEPLLGDAETIPRGIEVGPVPAGQYFGDQTCESCGGGFGMDAGDCGSCESCGDCSFDGCYGPPFGTQHLWGLVHRCMRSFSFNAGVHGFKGPVDLGQNGNFGIHEGLNFGAPLGGPFGIGYQIGFQATHSNFSGDQAGGVIRRSDRDQLFVTVGLFRRAVRGGLQWSVAFDMLHDSYHSEADFKQIRTETALVRAGKREIGFMGSFGVGDDFFNYDLGGGQRLLVPIQATDLYALFYRRYFSGGGQGRVWSGLSGEGDALFGIDGTVPLGTSWAMENNFTYLLPKQGRGAGAQTEEVWAVSMQLVWYPGREARSVRQNPFHPILSVADNSQFLLDRR